MNFRVLATNRRLHMGRYRPLRDLRRDSYLTIFEHRTAGCARRPHVRVEVDLDLIRVEPV